MIIPWAIWRPVSRIKGGTRNQKKAAVLHTAVSSAPSLYWWWQSGQAGSAGAHFYIAQYGELEQYVDTDFTCGHAWDANSFAVGIETWDGGHPETTPWNPAQLDTIDRLLRELDVPAKALLVGPSDGVGYHRQYDSWNRSNHSCPANPRVAQIPGIIARLAQEDDDLPYSEAQLKNIVKDAVNDLADYQAIIGFFAAFKDGEPIPTKPWAKAGWDAGQALKAASG